MERRSPQAPANGTVPSELAVRLLRSHHPYSASDERPRLFAGSLPDDPTFELPIPDGLVLVGSAVLKEPRGRRLTEIVLDTELSADRVRVAYRNLLSAAGWNEDRRTTAPGGFARGPRGFLISLSRAVRRSSRGVAADVPGLSTLFRRDAPREMLLVSAEERRGAPTDVRLRLVAGRNPSGRWRRNDPEALFVMPLLWPLPHSGGRDDENTGLLAPPLGSERSGGEFGGGSWKHDGAYSFTTLETDADLPSLVAHYAAQLEGAGWSRSGEGSDGPQAWSTWKFADDGERPWEAAFTALHLPGTPRRYLLHLRADRTPDP